MSEKLADKPNVLLLFSDQHNAKVMGHMGHANVKTPNLDRLAEEGVRFENAITQNPICTPSRMCYLSGQYAHNHGYYGLSGPNPEGLPSVFGHFKKYGYGTAVIGKVHCPEYWLEDDTDLYLETGGCSIGGNPEYTAYLKERGVLEDADYGRLQEQPKDMKGQAWDGRASRLKYDDSPEGWIAQRTISFMKECRLSDKPFIIQASFPKPHQIYAPSEPFWSMYNDIDLELPPNADYEMARKAPHLKSTADGCRTGDWTIFEPKTFEDGRKRKLQGYLGNISQVDHSVGQIVEWLDANGLSENTIVVYATDHGDYACEHGIMEKAPGICSDAITRIPYIWRWKGKTKPGHAPKAIVETVDFTTTACALAGIPPMETSDGKDLSALLRGGTDEVHAVGVTEFAWSKSLRKGKYRYVYYPKEMFADEYPDGFSELYDIEADPYEMKNLFFDAEYKSVVEELKGDLLEWLITTTRPTTVLPAMSFVGDQAIHRYKNAVNADGKFHPDRIREVVRSLGDTQTDFIHSETRKNYL